MKTRVLFALWGVLFIICAGMGFIPAEGGLGMFMTALSALFFLPPALIMYVGRKKGDPASIKLVQHLAAWSLVLTLGLLVANVLTVGASEAVGTALYYLLAIVSAPMVCSGYWAMSLFAWACLLLTARKLRRA